MPTRKSFYGLPAPWNPGYAIPRAVMEEGLQRHAYTTAWMPRGTYDRTTGGTAGYAIPEYVREERTGRGAYTTAWAPRGGPQIRHVLNRHPVANIVQRALSGLGAILPEYLPPKSPPPTRLVGRRAVLGAVPGATVNPTFAKQYGVGTVLGVGPFAFADKEGATIHLTPGAGASALSDLYARLKSFADAAVRYPAALANQMFRGAGPQVSSDKMFGTLFPKIALTPIFLGGGVGPPGAMFANSPIYQFKHPTTGKTWGVRIKNVSTNAAKPGFDLVINEKNTNWAEDLIDWVVSLPAKLWHFTCDMLQKPGFAAGAAAGTGGTGAVAVAVAAGICGQPPMPNAPVTVMPDDGSFMKTLLIGGAALAGLAILTKKKTTP